MLLFVENPLHRMDSSNLLESSNPVVLHCSIAFLLISLPTEGDLLPGHCMHLHVPYHPCPGEKDLMNYPGMQMLMIVVYWHWLNSDCFLANLLMLQLNIISTRNPSFWWHFSSKTAPPPALMLVVPVSVFLLGATFIAVYWPADVKPDGGLGFMEGVRLSWLLTIHLYVQVEIGSFPK